jgi:hypothetical protein
MFHCSPVEDGDALAGPTADVKQAVLGIERRFDGPLSFRRTMPAKGE